LGSHHARGLGRDHGVYRHDVGLGEQVVERVRGVVGVRIVRDHAHAEPLETPAGGAPDGTEADEAGGAPGELPGAEALVGDRPVAGDLALTDVPVGAHDAAGDGRQEADRELGDGVGVAPGRPQHGDAVSGGGFDVDVVRIAPAGPYGDEREIQDRALDRIALDHDDIRAFFGDAVGQLRGVVDTQRLLL